ncbi:hypothetical protein [Anaerosalibacter sp. Marseille-P3206]|uniref:hypothetical protein n=1 Tax=Anaerosalibacter sp. Marseille-P3206 TaxID=1871005 RepID=UPI000986783E|nr:hypothetical protein [Anaerosalibacter sp. Marseille-P3206]
MYEKIISNCELYAIDEKYREAVAHAIKLLLLDIEKSNNIKVGDNYIPVQIAKKVLIYNSINEIDIDMDSKLRYEDLIE